MSPLPPPMTIIDSQVHAYEANTPKRPWHSVPNWPDHVTGDEMVAAMDKVGVDGAIFISAFSMYRYDASYAVEVQRAHPDRFAIVKPVDPDDPAVADVIADWKKTPGAVGIRIMLTKEPSARPMTPASTGSCAPPFARFSGQHPVLGQPGRRHRADRPPSRHALHHRPSRHPAAA
jgi:predicted TIM-barrel fold metal-dependent hydrolase